MSGEPRSPASGVLATAVAIARISLGIVLLVGGWKLAFPADPPALVRSYVDPAAGWIAPFFVEWIEGYLRLDVLGFLRTLGWVEMTVGLALVTGFATAWFAALAGLLFLAFPMANPAPGMIRLAQDVSMGGFALAIAFTGSGRFSVDGRLGWFPEVASARRNWFLGLVRVALLYAFVMALLFPLGVGMNRLNQTLPWLAVFVLAVALVFPMTARFACGAIAAWMAVLVVLALGQMVLAQGLPGLYWGLDSAKRELALFGASLAYALAGPDRISLIPPGMPKERIADA